MTNLEGHDTITDSNTWWIGSRMLVKSLKLEFGQRQRHMVAMAALCRTRIRYIPASSSTSIATITLVATLRRAGIVLSFLSRSGGSCLVDVCYRFSIWRFGYIHEFNGDDFVSGVLIFMGMCMKAFRLWSTTSGRLCGAPATTRSGGCSGR
jgi:hypothetical protein